LTACFTFVMRPGRTSRRETGDAAWPQVLDRFANWLTALREELELPDVWAVETIVNNQVVKTFPAEPNGDIVQLATGNFVTRMTNTSTGKSITINISGPGRFTIHPNGSATLEATGRWFLGLIENAPFTAFISSGRVVISIAPDGTPTLVSQSGKVEDLCALLS